jgi:hypothetical protein
MAENQNFSAAFSEVYPIKFEENPSNGIGADTRSQAERQTSPHNAFLSHD